MGSIVNVIKQNAILSISLNRPAKKNAITAEMYTLMANAIDEAVADTSIKVICITGTEGHFTAGNDLGDFLANPDIQPGSAVYHFLMALMQCPLPIVAAISGFAVGIGSTLLLHCERVFADNTARFSFPFINLGLVPEAGSTLLLPQLVGYQQAADLLLTGRLMDAEEALKMGLIAAIVDDVNTEALAYASQLAQKSRAMLIEIKSLLRHSESNLMERVNVELTSFVKCLHSPAAKEAMTAFLEKRKPDFSAL